MLLIHSNHAHTEGEHTHYITRNIKQLVLLSSALTFIPRRVNIQGGYEVTIKFRLLYGEIFQYRLKPGPNIPRLLDLIF